ncbi:MAG: phage/plasmid primase, P4 family [Paracoccaceae bacterium]
MTATDDGFDGVSGVEDDFAPDDFGDAAPAPPDAELDAKLAEAAGFDLNDDGNGRRFALYFGDDLMNVPRVGWFNWTGKVWAADPDELEIKRKSQQVGQLVKREVFALRLPDRQMEQMARERELIDRLTVVVRDVGEDGRRTADSETEERALRDEISAVGKLKKSLHDMRAAHRRFANQTGNSARMKSMREEAGVRLARPLPDLDADPLNINTLSGVLRMVVSRDRDGHKVVSQELLPHARDQLLTKIMPVLIDEDAECPEFDRFFERIQPDPRMRWFLLRWFALSMTGLTEQKLAFLYGMGANGKSVLVDLMARIMGDYAAVAKIESLTGTNRRDGGAATPDLVPLIGARMVRAAEPDEGMRWQEGLIKDLTGGEPILVRALHADFVQVRPIFSLTISGNHKPDIRGTDDGIWRRLLLVPFDVSIPKAEQIHKAELDAMLMAEAPAILSRRLLPALRDFLERGLQEPDSVLSATAEFREESDPFGTFLDEACVVTGDAEETIKTRELTNAFHFWMLEKSEGAFKDRTVSLALKERSRRWVSRKTGRRFTLRKTNGQNVYDGIRFADLFKARFDRAPKDQSGRPLGVPDDTDTAPPSDAEQSF